MQLDLSHAPQVIYLFGLTGAGKSFVGDIIGRLAGWHVYHADVDLTAEMKSAIADKRTFTPEMRDRYFAVVANRILELCRSHSHLVVTQATYKRQHRDLLKSRIPGIDFICITADDNRIIENLVKRGDSVTPEYSARMRANFEPPCPSEKLLVNNGGEAEIVMQLNKFYARG